MGCVPGYPAQPHTLLTSILPECLVTLPRLGALPAATPTFMNHRPQTDPAQTKPEAPPGHDEDTETPLRLLLVEDNPAHAQLIIRIIKEQDLPTRIHHVYDGQTALDYLLRQGSYATAEQAPRPHVVLLNLYLPGVDGFEVLRTVKTSDALQSIPVIVLTSSASERDINRAYALHANSYLAKPLDFRGFEEMIIDLMNWLNWNYNTRL